MPRRIKYRFGGLEFTSQDGVKKHAATIREKYGIGATVADANDVAFLTDLISCHAERDTKIGPGIARFFVDSAPDHLASCFRLERLDGSSTDFGVPSCLIGIRRLNRLSLRMAIKPQLDAYRATRLSPGSTTFVSDYSKAEFPVEEAEVDHQTPFEDILMPFFKPRSIDIDSELLSKSADQRSDPVWREPVLIGEFLEFHRGFPLRLVQWRENASDIKRDARLQRTG